MYTLNHFALLFPVFVLTGCSNHDIEETMPSSFDPPGIESLVDIDVADTSYGKESIVIQGVVSAGSQNGWSGENDNYEVHHFTFAAWHRIGEPIVNRDLIILRPVAPGADYWDDFPEHSIHRISVLLSSDQTRAIFKEALPVDAPDEELQKISVDLQKPVVFSTKQFGDLVLDRRIDWFEAKVKWDGKTIRTTFSVDHDKPADNALKTAEELWSDQMNWTQRIEAHAVKELLELKNGNWLKGDETKFTTEQFTTRMTLTSISLSSEGEFEFWYDDGDLFWGHSIMVSGNLKDGPTEASIQG